MEKLNDFKAVELKPQAPVEVIFTVDGLTSEIESIESQIAYLETTLSEKQAKLDTLIELGIKSEKVDQEEKQAVRDAEEAKLNEMREKANTSPAPLEEEIIKKKS